MADLGPNTPARRNHSTGGSTVGAGVVPVTNSSGILDISLLATGTPDGTKFVRDDGTLQAAGGGSGTVTSVSVVTANGYSGTVATATTTPAITIVGPQIPWKMVEEDDGYDAVRSTTGTASSGGTPGGSTTQVQYNNAGAFAGSASFTFDGTTITSAAPVNFDGGALDSYIASTGIVTIGDANAGGNNTKVVVDDTAKQVWCQSNFANGVRLGDPANTGNLTELIVDDAAQAVSSNKDIGITDSAEGFVLKDTAGTPHYWRISVSTLGILSTTDLGTTWP